MAKEEENLFADPSVNNGSPKKYDVDLGNIPTLEENEKPQREEPEWDLNATTLKPSSAAPEYSAEDTSRRGSERRAFDESFDNSSDRRSRNQFEERFSRDDNDDNEDNGDVDYDDEEEEDDEDENKKKSFIFSPKVLIPKFKQLETKKKVIVAGISIVIIIILISILANVIGSISSAFNQPPTEPPIAASTPKPSNSATPAPIEQIPSKWVTKLNTVLGEPGTTIDGGEVTIDSVKCDIEAKNRNGAVVQSINGSWCVVNFTAKNVSDSILTFASQRFSIADIYDKETYYGDIRYGDAGGGNVISKLAPKESLSGFIYFDVPLGTDISKITVSTFGNTGGSPISIDVKDVRPSSPDQNNSSTNDPINTSEPSPSPTKKPAPTPTPTPTN